jgi:short-subunit dehydrogenase
MSIAIITGASSGIGREIARGLVARGVDEVWLVARRKDRLIELGEELGIKYKVISADLSVKEGIDALTSELCAERPLVKYFVAAAGFGDFGGFDEISSETVERMIDVNIKALVLTSHAVLPYMERGGRLLTLGSGSAFTPLPYFNVYAASKAFVLHYSKALYYEAKRYGVKVTCFCPGWVHTEFIDKATSNKGVTMPKKSAFWPLLNCERVVKKCLKALDKGKKLCTTGKFTKIQHLLFKIVPDGILSRAWLTMLVEPTEEKK